MKPKPAITLRPRQKDINATIDLPGSKSIANRVLLLAAVSRGCSILHNIPDVADDVFFNDASLKNIRR